MAMTRPAPRRIALFDRKLPDRTAAPDRNRLAALDVAEIRGHVPGRENVRQEKNLFVREPVLDLYRTNIRVRHPKIFGLTACVAA
jgi:hypothetical protein